jgi:hypothetical protein
LGGLPTLGPDALLLARIRFAFVIGVLHLMRDRSLGFVVDGTEAILANGGGLAEAARGGALASGGNSA